MDDPGAIYAFFRIITELGSETFFIVVIPPIYWCINKKIGYNLLVLSTLTAYITINLKNLTRFSRPSDRLAISTYSTYTFPSGHAHGTTAFWLYLWLIFKKHWLIILGVLIISLVSISRVYLRVHYCEDIIVGIALGVLSVIAFNVFEPKLTKIVKQLDLNQKLSLALIIPLLLIAHSALIFQLDTQAVKLSSALLGIFIGGVLEQKYVNFSTGTNLWSKLFRTFFGLFIAYLAYFGIAYIIPFNITTCILTSFLGGFTVTFIAPWAFTKLGK